MYLTKEEELVYNGGQGPTLQKMMEILVALGDIYGAEKLIPVKSAQIAGVSYKTIGDAGLQWISDLQGTAKIPAVLNPMGMDRNAWADMGIDKKFALKQEEIIKAYEKLGIKPECTCTPYYLDRPHFGDHLAWSESSAVCFANSVLRRPHQPGRRPFGPGGGARRQDRKVWPSHYGEPLSYDDH